MWSLLTFRGDTGKCAWGVRRATVGHASEVKWGCILTWLYTPCADPLQEALALQSE